jgi:photosystem II stability/assembly factor-like uncharacterized protein
MRLPILGNVIVSLSVFVYVVSCSQALKLPFVKVQFRGNTGWIVGGVTYVSTDGGTAWERLPFGYEYISGKIYHPTEARSRVQLVDERTGFHSFGKVLMRTRDEGRTWSEVSSEKIGEFYFADALTGCLLVTTASMGTTSDGGVHIAGGRGHWSHIAFLDTRLAFGTTGKTAYRSTDACRSWSEMRRLENPIETIRVYDGKVWFVGLQGMCNVYDPLLDSWQECSVRSNVAIYDVSVSRDRIVAVGGGGAIFESARSPVKWSQSSSGTDAELVSVDFGPDGAVYSVGGKGLPTFPFHASSRVALVSRSRGKWEVLRLPR